MEFVGKCLIVEEEGKKILVVGDLHLGYEESLNQTGVFVGREMFEEMISYFDSVFSKVGKIDSVVLLGDVKHVFGSVLRQEWNDVLGLIEYLEEKVDGKEIIIIKGNHDKIIEPVARKKGVRVVDYLIVGKYCFVHGDKEFEEMFRESVKVWVMGHGHPAVKISDGVKVEKFKCFLVGKFKKRKVVIVPSFIEGNVGSDPREFDLGMKWDFDLDKFDFFVVNEELEVLEFGRLGKLK